MNPLAELRGMHENAACDSRRETYAATLLSFFVNRTNKEGCIGIGTDCKQNQSSRGKGQNPLYLGALDRDPSPNWRRQ